VEDKMELTLTAILGLSNSPLVSNDTVVQFRKSLKELSSRDYETDVKKFKLKLIVEGDKSKTKEDGGIFNLRFSKAVCEVSVELIIKYNDLKKKDERQIKSFLADNIELAFLAMIKRVLKENLKMKSEEFLADLKDQLQKI
jgi:hypothetical protein